jgi:FkbM family methyltransferase
VTDCDTDQDYILAEIGDGLRFWINPRDHYVSQGMRAGMWERGETAFVKRTLKAGMHAVDIGANLGWFTVHMAKLVGADGSVVAFEPRRDLHRQLPLTVLENGLTNVTVHQLALGEKNGEGLLRWDKRDDNPGSTHLAPRDVDDDDDRFVFQRSDVVTLDSIVTHPIDFIKIDVEGAEKLVFDGANRVFSHDRPVMLAELAPDLLRRVSGVGIDEYFSYLGSRNYTVQEIDYCGDLSGPITSWPHADWPDLINVALTPAERSVP